MYASNALLAYSHPADYTIESKKSKKSQDVTVDFFQIFIPLENYLKFSQNLTFH